MVEATPRMTSPLAQPRNPTFCKGSRPTRSTSRMAMTKPTTRRMSRTAVPVVSPMSFRMKSQP
jgi:hypothetical protein